MEPIQTGQRWISVMEPELGLGTVTEVSVRTVRVHFAAGNCERMYARDSAPLRRVRFRPGDTVISKNGESLPVERVEDRDGILTYFGGARELSERDLSDTLSFTTPADRLLGGFLDSNFAFDLRFRTLLEYSAWRKSPVRGFLGGRIDLIPHQLYVAGEVAARPIPRVMLSDEAGLGKTIEACLVLHRLLLTGRIGRVLILVPETLVFQWFVELLRKFNLLFRILDEETCASIQEAEPEANPFLKDQLCLCALDVLAGSENRRRQAVEAGWDMLVVDEAHHLTEGGPAYDLVRTLGAGTPGLMLLTATPEQLGRRSHVARLRLLDPDRYRDFETFESEERRYRDMAGLAGKILDGKTLTGNEQRTLAVTLPDREVPHDAAGRRALLADLLDRHGTGRVQFRNTRAVMTGFPKRDVRLVPLRADAVVLERLTEEFRADAEGRSEDAVFRFEDDPRIEWLTGLLHGPKPEKVLLICRSADKALAVDRALKNRLKIHTALFHEGLTLIQRDRNAAWFARKDGAGILVCSEIGSEGRNFQFAKHLVLFDLPLDPELLEQRIGRLDRIGQKETIHIHVPCVEGSSQEVLARWYHEGLDAFRQNVPGAYELYQTLGPRIRELAAKKGKIEAFLQKTRREGDRIAGLLAGGRDRLLELHSFHREEAEQRVHAIQAFDRDGRLDAFAEALLGEFGIVMEEASKHTFRIRFDALVDPAFPVPVLREENLTATFDRSIAVEREDIEFLSWDHPMITGAAELLLGSEKGNSTAALWPESGSSEMLLEAVFVLECVAAPRLHADRFLPPTPVRSTVNHLLEDAREAGAPDGLLKGVPSPALLQNAGVRALIPRMIARCGEIARESAQGVIDGGLRDMEAVLENEIRRLQELKKVNPSVREEEIRHFEEERSALHSAILSARLRLDALRLIFKS